MATAPPDPHPDSLPTGPEETPEQSAPDGDDGRESVEDIPTSRLDATLFGSSYGFNGRTIGSPDRDERRAE